VCGLILASTSARGRIQHHVTSLNFITVRRYASAVYAVVVCLSVCLSQIGVLPNLLNVGWRKQRRTIAQGPVFWRQRRRRNTDGISLNGSVDQMGWIKISCSNQYLATSKKRYNIGNNNNLYSSLRTTRPKQLMQEMGQNRRRHVCFVRFARWWHRGRSLPSPTASRSAFDFSFQLKQK